MEITEFLHTKRRAPRAFDSTLHTPVIYKIQVALYNHGSWWRVQQACHSYLFSLSRRSFYSAALDNGLDQSRIPIDSWFIKCQLSTIVFIFVISQYFLHLM